MSEVERDVLLAVGALLVVCGVRVVSRRLGLPAPVLLVVLGLIYARLPGPNVELDPEAILVGVLPPLLFSAALGASAIEIRSHLRPVILLSVGLTLATAFAVAGLLIAVVGGLPFAAALALGACVAPNDPVAALAIGRRVALPRRVTTVIEGESLVNDATALTTWTVAVAAVSGSFSTVGALGRFSGAVLGGAAIGLAVGWVVARLRRDLSDPVIDTALLLVTPWLAFIPADEAQTSGVLAVVVAGLWLGHQTTGAVSGPARLQGRSVWRIIDFVLEGSVFLLIGNQLAVVVQGLEGEDRGTLVAASALALGAVLLVRPAWIALTMWRRGTGSEVLLLSWAGMRGVVSLAAAFALPEDVPQRDLLLLVAFVVVLGTLLLQGLTLAPLVRRLPVSREVAPQLEGARRSILEAGLACLDGAEAEPGALERVRTLLRDRLGDLREDGSPGRAETARLRIRVIEAERAELLRLRDAGVIDEFGARQLQRELDHEERALAVVLGA